MIRAYSGATINTMVLAGLVIAMGEVVDDAIIDVENIVRRLIAIEPRGGIARGRPIQVVLARRRSRSARARWYIASIIVILVFIPVFFLEGL